MSSWWQGFLEFFLERIKLVIICICILFGLLIAGITMSYFAVAKKAEISAEIGLGFAYLDEGSNEVALVFFERAFNKADGLCGIISGSGVVKSLYALNGFDKSFKEKSQNVLSIMKEYKTSKFIQMFTLSVYLQNSAKFTKGNLNENVLKSFESYAKRKGGVFLIILQNIELNLGS